MEANRKRPSPSLPRTGSDISTAPTTGSKIWRSESPRKRPRPRSSGLHSRDPVKDLRSHRVFSPSSDLTREMLSQQIGFESDPNGKGNSGFPPEDRSLDTRIGASNGTKSIIRPCIRGKLFKTPASVSYKRLLPYLNSCDGEIDRSPKLGVSSDEKDLRKSDSITTQKEIVVDFGNGSFDGGKLKIPSSEDVALPLSIKVKDNCHLDTCGNGLIQKPGINVSSHDAKPKDSESHMAIPCMARDGDTEIADLPDIVSGSHVSKVVELGKSCDGQIGVVDGDGTNRVEELNDDSIQMTPPDPEVMARPEMEGSEAVRQDYVIDPNNLSGNVSNGVADHEISSLVSNTRYEINNCRGVSKPRSQMKLFRSPGSFSYRRMLPFLMEIAKDHSDALANGQLGKPEKYLEQPETLVSDNQVVHLDESNVGFEVNQKDGNQISTINGTKIEVMSNAESEELFQVKEEVVSSVLTNAEPKSKELAISKSNQVITSEAEVGLSRLTIGLDTLKPVKVDKPDCMVLSRFIPPSGPRKGILKRNPRGCRGLCTCLNCASFRLHAERAFEFSRNQMEESEEMVLKLVNELSYLRNVLEKSAEFEHDQHAIYVDQVKEACKKASDAEELAKDRLDHMNYDLGVHCRITCLERPRVTFANRIEETNFPTGQIELKHTE